MERTGENMPHAEMRFEFTTSGLSELQNEALLRIILAVVEACGGAMGGGMVPDDGADTGEKGGPDGEA